MHYRLPRDERRRVGLDLDEIKGANGLSRSQEMAILQLATAGWSLPELSNAYKVPESVVSETISKMEKAIVNLHRAGVGPYRLANSFGLTVEEVKELLAPRLEQEKPWTILPVARRHPPGTSRVMP